MTFSEEGLPTIINKNSNTITTQEISLKNNYTILIIINNSSMLRTLTCNNMCQKRWSLNHSLFKLLPRKRKKKSNM